MRGFYWGEYGIKFTQVHPGIIPVTQNGVNDCVITNFGKSYAPRAKRPCRHKGCTAVTNDVSGFCEIHRQQHAGDGWRNYQPGKLGMNVVMVVRGN
jgi:hypothetical protein